MTWHPLELMRIIFAVLVAGLVIAGLTTGARPRTRREWTLVWAVLVFLVWALLGFGWLRSRTISHSLQNAAEGTTLLVNV